MLIQEVLSDGLSRPRKAPLHTEIDDAPEESYEGEIEVHAAELAYHFARAASITGRDKLVRYSLITGPAMGSEGDGYAD